jgi:gas vesicle protein
MRYKAVFIAGFAAGFLAGARSGRGTYDKIMAYSQKVASNPKVRSATESAQAKATDLAKSAAAKAPDAAKSAAKTAQAQVSQVPKYVSTAKEAAAAKMPFGGSGGQQDADATVAEGPVGHVDADGNLVYPAEGSPSVNGTVRHYNPEP